MSALRKHPAPTDSNQALVQGRQSGKTQKNIEHYRTAMAEDGLRLKALNDVTAKISAKRNLIAVYLPFIDDYLDSGANYPNDVAVQVMVWLFDIADIERALKLAFVLIDQQQKMPERFKRSDIATFVCDAMYDWALSQLDKQSASPYLDWVVDKAEQQLWELSPVVMSKTYAMLAKHKFKANDFAAVVALCDKAKAVNPEKHGTMTLRNNALALLNK